jgi:flavin-binding protein dodecin
MSETPAYRGESRSTKTEAVSGVSKVIELYAESPKSWEQAVQLCLAEAVRTVRNITSLSVDSLNVSVKDDVIQNYQVRCKISFTIDDSMRAH